MSTPHICQTTDLLILGAGITGLAAGYFLKDKASLQIIDAAFEPGGVIKSTRVGDFLLEQGPDCFMNQTPWALDLALELGLQHELIESKNFQRRVLVLRQGRLESSDYEDKAVTEFLGDRAQTSINPNTFLTFRHGMQTLTNALAAELQDCLLLNTKISPSPPFSKRGVILSTLPAEETARLLGQTWPQFKTTKTTSTYLAYRRQDVQHPLDAFGAIIPLAEKKSFSALTFISSKFDHRCPEGFVLIRVFSKPDLTLNPSPPGGEGLKSQVEQLLGISGTAVLEESFTLKYADPKYAPDHLAQVESIEKSLPSNFFIAGSPYRGVGISDCIQQAKTFLRVFLTKVKKTRVYF